MSKEKPLSAKQLAVINDLFEDKKEQEILKKHKLNRKLYEKWLADESFNRQLDRRAEWEYRKSAFRLARSTREAVTNLIGLTKSQQSETARKACIDIITMRANLLTGKSSANPTVLPADNSNLLPESTNISPETAGKLLAVLAEGKNESIQSEKS